MTADDASGPDLRLAPTALGAWLSALWTLHLSPGAGTALTVVTGSLAVLLWYAAGRRQARPTAGFRGVRVLGHALPRTATGVLIGVLLGAAIGAVSTTARTSARDAEPLARLVREQATVVVDLTVSDDPRRARTGRVWLVDARITRLRTDTAGQPPVRVDARVLVLSQHSGWRGLLPGQRVSTTARLVPPSGGDLRAAVLSASGGPRIRGRPPLPQRAAGSLRHGLQVAAQPLPDDAGGLLPGLAIGDVSRMDPAVEEDFRASGMTHLTAVSGSNVAIIVGLVLWLAAWCRAGPRTAALLALLALVGFVILVRPSPSVLRAGVMGGLALAALASSRPRAAVPALNATVVLLIVADPELAGDVGFALSVLATAGLLFLAPTWRDALRRRGVPPGVAEAVAVPAAAQAACSPVIAAMTGTVSLTAVPANLLAAPAVAPATVLGATAAAVSPLSPGLAEFLAWLGGWPARWLVWVAHWGAGLPASAAPWPGGAWGGILLALCIGMALLATRWATARKVLAVSTVAALLGAGVVRTVTPGWPPPDWSIVACDVGQGDALVLRTGDSQAVVVDAGPAPAPVDRCMRRLGIATVPLFVATHYHADHVGGLAGVLRGRRVAAIAGPAFTEPPDGYATVAGQADGNGTPLLALGAGWRYRAGRVLIETLGPADAVYGSRSDANNNSLVLRVTLNGITVLLPGDAEVDRQRALLTNGEPVRADVLKLAHHGSRYQDPQFLTTVDPAVVLVSVGKGNDYGHPDGDLLRRLARDGARVFRTDLRGDLAVTVTREGLEVTCLGRQPGERPP